jgi:hypothetical protein
MTLSTILNVTRNVGVEVENGLTDARGSSVWASTPAEDADQITRHRRSPKRTKRKRDNTGRTDPRKKSTKVSNKKGLKVSNPGTHQQIQRSDPG